MSMAAAGCAVHMAASSQRRRPVLACRRPGQLPPRRLLAVLVSVTAAQMQFEIPAEMLQGMMGGMMGGGGGGRGRKPTEWPKTENSEIASELDWLVNTEWQGKTAKYLLLRDGFVESDLKECEHEGQCLWAANNGKLMINTPTLKVVKFGIDGLDKADGKKLQNKDLDELKKLTMTAEKASKSGKKSQLKFSKLATADESDNIIARDLYEVLEVSEQAEASEIKSKYRKMSVKHHPDKGGSPQLFNEIREAYEVLGDADKRRYYDVGGMQLVKNIETAWKEVEGQKAQMDAQLNQVPKNHPQYRQFKAQIEAQKQQFDQKNSKWEIEKKMRSDDIEVTVPVPVEDLYRGAVWNEYEFQRLVICRGCRVSPDKPECQGCGRCPPEKVQVPKYGMTPFGRQVVGMREKEQESLEKCREQPVTIKNLKIPAGAKEGHTLKYASDVGHQTPGKLPGRVVLKLQRGSPKDTYAIAETDLHTVLHLSLEQALFGFSVSWKHLGNEMISISRERVAQANEVLKLKKKGLVGEGNARGDLYVRLAVDLPQLAAGAKEHQLRAGDASKAAEAKLTREDLVELREGSAWRQWRERQAATLVKSPKGSKQEL
eukprot:TRINITY_DN11448_c0_g1_i1.p1 TRINITY_DN11448_c0_g1~~TRINITY_DN11448_c0_g1_i1.p1  ORF type:complete len:601 (+),score=168.40 TRINITY_DN11448_c0_g1_i1:53-1855(+)